jgi:hypothetical protein
VAALTGSGNPPDPPRPLDLIALALTGLPLGASLGALTNAVNGRVSPLYFITILGWDAGIDVPTAAIGQGVFEGLLYGAVLSVLFTAAVGWITRAACPYGLAVRYQIGIFLGSLACWMVGGACAVGLALLSPEFYRSAFIGVPGEREAMLRYAWVGGSIWGVELGGVASALLAVVLLRARWRLRAGPGAVRS